MSANKFSPTGNYIHFRDPRGKNPSNDITLGKIRSGS